MFPSHNHLILTNCALTAISSENKFQQLENYSRQYSNLIYDKSERYLYKCSSNTRIK